LNERKPLSPVFRKKISEAIAAAWKKNPTHTRLFDLRKMVGLSLLSLINLKCGNETHERVTGEKLVRLFAVLGCTVGYYQGNTREPVTDLSLTLEQLHEEGAFLSFPE
jgi:hypothetical protein